MVQARNSFCKKEFRPSLEAWIDDDPVEGSWVFGFPLTVSGFFFGLWFFSSCACKYKLSMVDDVRRLSILSDEKVLLSNGHCGLLTNIFAISTLRIHDRALGTNCQVLRLVDLQLIQAYGDAL
ncbi:hypothetical protein V6N13_106940 [Hibiscus sabdariffa]